MNVLYPNEAQARRYLVYWQCLAVQKRAGLDRAAAYLTHLSPETAQQLASEFKFPWPLSTTS